MPDKQLYKINCHLHDNWHEIKTAMAESATMRSNVSSMVQQVKQLNELPSIASEIRNLNRNNTILLIILGSLLIINAVANAGINFKGSIPGSSVEMTGRKDG